jgi:hypothetical protein
VSGFARWRRFGDGLLVVANAFEPLHTKRSIGVLRRASTAHARTDLFIYERLNSLDAKEVGRLLDILERL